MKLNAIQEMGYDEFALRSTMNMPSRLYRYYPDVASNEKPLVKQLIILFRHWKIILFFSNHRQNLMMYTILIYILIISRFQKEVRLTSRLNHPNIIKIVAQDTTGDRKYYIILIRI